MPRQSAAIEPDLGPRQRSIIAQRLAAGDPPILAAAMAGVRLHDLERALGAEPELLALIEACRALYALPVEAWRARLEGLVRDATERAVVDGKLGTLNLCLRASGLLADPAEPEEEPDELEAFLAGLTPEQLAEYEALDGGEEGEGEGEEDGEAAVLPFRRAAAPPRPVGATNGEAPVIALTRRPPDEPPDRPPRAS